MKTRTAARRRGRKTRRGRYFSAAFALVALAHTHTHTHTHSSSCAFMSFLFGVIGPFLFLQRGRKSSLLPA